MVGVARVASMRGAARRALALAWLFAVVASARPAGAATLIGARTDGGAGGAPRLVLVFNGGVPVYRIVGNASSDITIVLAQTAAAPTVPVQIGGSDLLVQATLAPAGANTTLVVHLSAAARVDVANGPGQSLVCTFTALGAQVGFFGPGGSTAAAAAPSAEGAIEVIPLKYADVSEVVGLLVAGQQIPSNDVFVPQQQNFGSSSNGYGTLGGLGQSAASTQTAFYGGGTGGAPSLGQTINENIGVDRRLNAIVLSGAPDVVARLKANIAKLDVPLPSVVLETQVVELTDTAAHDVGIDFTGGNTGQIAAASYQAKSLTTGTGTLSLQAAVYEQITLGRGKVIARPRIVAQSGSSAQILTGDALPIVTSIAVSGVNAVSQQVQYVNVGVSLQIQPRVSSDGFVTSHIFSEVSSVTGYSQGYPTLSQREATTSATVRDGEAFVIGGLLETDELDTFSKIPGLADLPVIGWLFRLRHASRETTNLYIIVVPHVVTGGNPPPADLAK
jgi:general secretion pathway protein D